MIDSNDQHRLEKITRGNIQKDPLTLRTKYPFDSLLQVDAILVVACRSLACRSLVNRALFSLGNVTDAETIKNDSLVIIATLTDFLQQDATLYGMIQVIENQICDI